MVFRSSKEVDNKMSEKENYEKEEDKLFSKIGQEEEKENEEETCPTIEASKHVFTYEPRGPWLQALNALSSL